MKATLRKWYNDGFKQLKVIPPPHTWKNISNEMRAFPDGWFQLNSDNLDTEPGPKSWDAIFAGMQPYNLSKKAGRQAIYRGTVAVLVFAVLPFAFNDMNSRVSDTSPADRVFSQNEQVLLAEWNSFEQRTPIETQINAQQIQNAPVELPSVNRIAISDKETILDRELLNTADLTVFAVASELHSELKRGPVDLLSFAVVAPTFGNIPATRIKNTELIEAPALPRQKWGIGPKVNVHGSRFLTPQSSLALSSSNVVQNPFGFNFSFGLTGNYEFNPKSLLELDLMFNDRKTQRIQDYVGSNYVERRTDLSYTSLSFSYKRTVLNPRKQTKCPLSVHFISGLYASYQTKISELLNDESVVQLRDGYGSMDFGINSGVDFSVRISPKIEWTSGVKYQVGLINIFNGIDKIPASFFRTYTQSVGITTALLYRF